MLDSEKKLAKEPKKEIETKITSIQAGDIEDVAQFMHVNMNDKFTADTWARTLKSSWVEDIPNYGFMLKNKNQDVVGVLCALYSQQEFNGRIEQMCNPHSWCVLPEYRTKSVQLVLGVIRQKGYHFTMFTPNKSGLEIFAYLRFKPLENEISTLLNIPKLTPNKLSFIDDSPTALACLSARDRVIYKDHLKYPWLDRIVFGSKGKFGFILFKQQKFKKLNSINIIFVSDLALFSEFWSDIRSFFLLKRRIFTTRIESRYLKHAEFWSLKPEHGQQKFYLSSSLEAEDIQNIYSELVAMDL